MISTWGRGRPRSSARSWPRPGAPDGRPGCTSRRTPGCREAARPPPTGPAWWPRRSAPKPPATLTLPEARFDLVRTGGGIFGLSTLPGGPPGWLRPAMTVRTVLVQVKRVPAGTGVSYGHRYLTSREATLGLVPLGYAEGVPRQATNTAQVQVRGRRWTISGTVCMDQMVVDFGDEPVAPGDEVVLFGPGDSGEPTAQGWADALGTLSYDIVTRFAGRMPRSYRRVTDAANPTMAAASPPTGTNGG